MRVNHRRRDVGMAEQILHGSNVVTAAEQGRRERVAEGVRCGGLRDACLFYGTFEGALKGLVIHVMATHDTAPWIGRMRVLRKNPEPRPGMPGARILGSSDFRWGSGVESAGCEEHAEAVVGEVAVAAGEAAVELDDAVDGLGAPVVGPVGGEVGQKCVFPAA